MMNQKKRGRLALGAGHVHKFQASEQAKTRLELILQTLSGEKTIEDACLALSISEAAFHKLRDQTLAAALANLEPKPKGRPRKPAPTAPDEDIHILRDELIDAQMRLYAAQVREEIALTMPHLLKKKRPTGTSWPGGPGPRRKSSPVRMALRPRATDPATSRPIDPVAQGVQRAS